MPDIGNLFPSKYLRGSDLPPQGVTVTISQVTKDQLFKPGEGKVDTWILTCEKASKGVILSRALAYNIVQALGESNTDKWAGRQVILYPEPMKVGGQERIAIRARGVAHPQAAGAIGNTP